MLTERGFQSIALGQQARDFIAWSRDTGATLARMYRKPQASALEIAYAWQEAKQFPRGTLEVLHQKDLIHHPAVLLARKRTQTYFQNLPPLISSAKERYTRITQIGSEEIAVGISISRTLASVPDGMVLTFGKHCRHPNYEGIYGVGLIQVTTNGETRLLAPKRTPNYVLAEHVGRIIKKIMRAEDVTGDPFVRQLGRVGLEKWAYK